MAPSGRKLAIGCAVGCGALALVAVAVLASLVLWVRAPGTLLEPERMLGADTTGHVQWTLRLEDPGTEGFVRLLARELRQVPQHAGPQLPGWLKTWTSAVASFKTDAAIRELLPAVVAFTLQPGDEPESDLQVLSLDAQHVSHRLILFDWLLGKFIRRGPIYRLGSSADRGATFFIRDGAVYFASDVAAAELAVDRLAATPLARRAATPLERWFAETAGNAPLRGAVSNDHGELVRLWRRWAVQDGDAAPPAGLAELRGVTIRGGLGADGSLAATLELIGPDEAWPAAHAGAVVELLRSTLAPWGGEADLAGPTEGPRVRVTLRWPELIGRIGSAIERGLAEGRRPAAR